ncbi:MULTISPECIES: hypothetical protein [Mesorhizobium]|uniref:Transmembrane protein n=1 Tax=Mesorhizobium opportunistum (strain LMG 24607 / HAMBI 3007 / WSM2075) TaxID=536019 RepID=F7Y6U3_MESOW|nr:MULTISPECIES: hypothetical protein [Mesorhizobium]AEH87413.1 putative transmembrane protein [Mesorhizobium opportunistum WSM2075]MCA0030290.1 hypothetical protein [Mesorhizobium sp. B263B2A]
MQISVVGLLVCCGILAVVTYMRWSMITALIASLAFGATAIGTIGSLGGSSPLIFTIFNILLIATALARRGIWREIGIAFGHIGATWIVCALMIYVTLGALLFPRLFEGQTSAFVASRTGRGVYEAALAPVSANISQTGYFVLAGLTFLAVCVLVQREGTLTDIKRGYFLWFILHVSMGMLDLLGKVAGAGDILAPIRTANYSMLTDVTEAGFFRIAGAFSEASAFGGVSLSGLAFSYTYWTKTGSKFALGLGSVLFGLLLLSTSSTAYVGLTIVSLPVVISIATSLASGRLRSGEALLLTLLMPLLLLGMGVILFYPHFLDPVVQLVDTTIINKVTSTSGQERSYWNYKSLQSFFDTAGLGVGLGSSRASSWPIALLSQLGLFGTVIMMVLLAMLMRGLRGSSHVDPQVDAIASSARACALSSLVAGSLASGSPDPGIVFYIPLAVVLVCRRLPVKDNRAVVAAMPRFDHPVRSGKRRTASIPGHA